jgi:hypothetical protein
MDKGYIMKPNSRKDYLRRIYPRYRQASPAEKRRILDEFCAHCGYHRKYAIRLLKGPPPGPRPRRARRPRLISILKAIWEAADYPWSVRLKALLPEWLPWIRRRFRLRPELERQLLSISPRSIDYRLRPHKRQLRRRLYGRTQPGTLLKHHIPVKTDRWDVQLPGFTEIDLVSHSAPSASGDCCPSLNLTDIHTPWTETQAVLGKGQGGVRQALDQMCQALPFPLQGIDSDTGSEFINDPLYRYCQAQRKPPETRYSIHSLHRFPPASTERKRSKKEREKPTTTGYILCCLTILPRVTFLNCLTGGISRSGEVSS